MSILDLPRLHFRGFARTHAPTGHKNGLVDLSTNTVYMDGDRFYHRRPASEYHEYLQRLGPRFNAEGSWDEDGPFSMAKGWDFGGNGHFAIEAEIVNAQREPGQVDRQDPVVGRSVEMWGHYNEYLGTTFNRARIFDCDPASNWTTTIMVGQFTFGRQGNSQETPNLLSAPVEGMQPARWQNFNYIRELPKHCLNQEFQRSAVHQFTVSKTDPDLLWEESVLSPTVASLRQAMLQDDVLGLVVQFSLSNMSAPVQPDSPVFWNLHGTIGLWRQTELSTYPQGRLLTPRSVFPSPEAVTSRTLSNLTVQITPQGASLNLITAVPCVGRAAKPERELTPAIGTQIDLGELELRTTKNQRLIARIPPQAYQREAHQLTSGIVDVPLVESFESLRDDIEQQGLCIVGTQPNGQHQILVQEEEINLQVEQACLFVEFPNWQRGDTHTIDLEVRSFVRGHPAPVEAVHLHQFYNPRGLPHLHFAAKPDERSPAAPTALPRWDELNILHFKPGRKEDDGNFAPTCVISTDEQGRGWVTLQGAQSGTTRVLLSTHPNELPCNTAHPNEALILYDNDDRLGFWSGAGFFAVRVLPDDWHLEEIEDEAVDFDLIYEHILVFYELCFSFMKAEVFSLGDRCKVENYARLMWQMSDPCNKNKTYYMPPTRDMSQPKAMLLRQFLRNQQRVGYLPPATPNPKQTQRQLQDRHELVAALRQAAELEVAVMLQYVYAAYSIPNYATGEAYVQRGLWTVEQLQLACGDGKETHDYGMRGVLLEIAREEMIHFLLVNNVLMALGEPFYAATPNFSQINRLFPIEIDLALEPFSAATLQRFIRLEWPDALVEDLVNESGSPDSTSDRLHGYGSLSELYRQIRSALKDIPDLIVAKQGQVGGEHHLFLRQDFNRAHPDYQLQVNDVKSALFAIDLIVEQGEGCNPEAPNFEQSHFQKFQCLAVALAQEQGTGCKVPWNPAYPALRNPTLHHQDYNTSVVTVPQTQTVMQIFNECYCLMMQLMVQHFGWMPHSSLRRSKLMNAAIDVMTGMMRPLGELLMTLPSGKRGKTAGPSFEITTPPTYISTPETAYEAIADRFKRLVSKPGSVKRFTALSTRCSIFTFASLKT